MEVAISEPTALAEGHHGLPGGWQQGGGVLACNYWFFVKQQSALAVWNKPTHYLGILTMLEQIIHNNYYFIDYLCWRGNLYINSYK